MSLDKPVGEDGDTSLGDLLAIETASVDEEVQEALPLRGAAERRSPSCPSPSATSSRCASAPATRSRRRSRRPARRSASPRSAPARSRSAPCGASPSGPSSWRCAKRPRRPPTRPSVLEPHGALATGGGHQSSSAMPLAPSHWAALTSGRRGRAPDRRGESGLDLGILLGPGSRRTVRRMSTRRPRPVRRRPASPRRQASCARRRPRAHAPRRAPGARDQRGDGRAVRAGQQRPASGRCPGPGP